MKPTTMDTVFQFKKEETLFNSVYVTKSSSPSTKNVCVRSISPVRFAIMENMRHYLSTYNPSEALFFGHRFQSSLYGGPGNGNVSNLKEMCSLVKL